MGARSGLSASLGVAVESVFGTYVAPTKHIEVNSAEIKLGKNVAQGQGLAAGRSLMHVGRRALTTRQGSGSVNLDVVNRGLLALYSALFGSNPTPALVATKTLSYQAVFPLADQFGRSLSMQLGVPPVDKATPQAFTYLGCKVTEIEFSCDAAGILTAAVTVDTADVIAPTDSAAKTLVAASYPVTLREFVGTDCTIKITPAGGSQVVLQGVRGWKVKVTRSLDTGRFYVGQGPTKAEPLANAYQSVTGSLNADYAVDAAGAGISLASLFAADTTFALEITALGNLIETGQRDTWSMSLPVNKLDDQTPTVGGPDIVRSDYPFASLTDDTGAVPTLTIVSADSSY